jgi:hypothetical protein
MKNSVSLVLFLIVVMFLGNVFTNAEPKTNIIEPLATVQEWIPCTVKDPTGTPLNVRAKPNGRIIAKLKNDTLVAIDDSTAGNKWSRISFKKGRKQVTGWVLRDYLGCQ